ncbi:hypothetical protein HOD08_05315 [bacterium]|nr:hypothetical protein [bacterium]
MKKIILAGVAFLLCVNLSADGENDRNDELKDKIAGIVDRFVARKGESANLFVREFVELVSKDGRWHGWIHNLFDVVEQAGVGGEEFLKEVSELTSLGRDCDRRRVETKKTLILVGILAFWFIVTSFELGLKETTCFWSLPIAAVFVLRYCISLCCDNEDISRHRILKNLKLKRESLSEHSGLSEEEGAVARPKIEAHHLLTLVKHDYDVGRDIWRKFGREKLDLIALREIMRDRDDAESVLKLFSGCVELVFDSVVEGDSLLSRCRLDVEDSILKHALAIYLTAIFCIKEQIRRERLSVSS